jgi:hypothetical protein
VNLLVCATCSHTAALTTSVAASAAADPIASSTRARSDSPCFASSVTRSGSRRPIVHTPKAICSAPLKGPVSGTPSSVWKVKQGEEVPSRPYLPDHVHGQGLVVHVLARGRRPEPPHGLVIDHELLVGQEGRGLEESAPGAQVGAHRERRGLGAREAGQTERATELRGGRSGPALAGVAVVSLARARMREEAGAERQRGKVREGDLEAQGAPSRSPTAFALTRRASDAR